MANLTRLTLVGCPFSGEEVALLILAASKSNPDAFTSDAVKAVIYKAKSVVAKSKEK